MKLSVDNCHIKQDPFTLWSLHLLIDDSIQVCTLVISQLTIVLVCSSLLLVFINSTTKMCSLSKSSSDAIYTSQWSCKL